MTLPVGRASRLHEAVVEREVVPDRVPPAGPARPEVRVVVEDVLVDVGKHQLAVWYAEDGHGYEADVAVLRFGFVRG